MFPKQAFPPPHRMKKKVTFLNCCVRDKSKFLLRNLCFQPSVHLATIIYLKKIALWIFESQCSINSLCLLFHASLFLQRRLEQRAIQNECLLLPSPPTFSPLPAQRWGLKQWYTVTVWKAWVESHVIITVSQWNSVLDFENI